MHESRQRQHRADGQQRDDQASPMALVKLPAEQSINGPREIEEMPEQVERDRVAADPDEGAGPEGNP